MIEKTDYTNLHKVAYVIMFTQETPPSIYEPENTSMETQCLLSRIHKRQYASRDAKIKKKQQSRQVMVIDLRV